MCKIKWEKYGIRLQIHSSLFSQRQCKEFADVPYYGTYAFGLRPLPVLTVTDLDMVQNVYGEYNDIELI